MPSERLCVKAEYVPRSAAEWGQEIRAVAALADSLWAIELVKRVT